MAQDDTKTIKDILNAFSEMKEDGPCFKSIQTTVSFEHHKKLNKLSKQLGVSKAELLRRALMMVEVLYDEGRILPLSTGRDKPNA